MEQILHFQKIAQWKLFCLTVLFNTLQKYITYFSIQMPGEYIFLADLAAGNSGTNLISYTDLETQRQSYKIW